LRFSGADYRLFSVKRPCFLRTWSLRLSAVLLSTGLLGSAGACKATYLPATGDVSQDLRHRDPRVRIQATAAAVKESRRDLLPDLVDTLEDRDPAVRMFASAALRALTGHDFGFQPYGSPTARSEAVGRWRAWLERDVP
jgi:hypothetical protein